MKIYIYSEYDGRIKSAVTEAEEKPKTYRNTKRGFPLCYRCLLSKDKVGEIDNDFVFFLEPSFEKAKQMFLDRKNKRIESAKKEIERLEHEKESILGSEDK